MMLAMNQLLRQLDGGEYDDRLRYVYCCDDVSVPHARIHQVADGFCKTFSRASDTPVTIFSAPGRSELGGNHTDHQHGHVLTASVNLDVLACAAPNDSSVIRIQSEGFPLIEVALDVCTPVPEEQGTSTSLVRGIAARMQALGHTVHGFDAYLTSNVLTGSGLSSSAAFEVLIGVILNQFFCSGAFSAIEIAQISQYAENVFFGKPCGLMDQMGCSVGGAVAIDFADPAAPVVRQIDIDLHGYGYALCIIDSGADHADLTDAYAAIPREMGAVAACFGKQVLRDVDPEAFRAALGDVRAQTGDRAVLRALHFFDDDRRAAQEADALEAHDFDRFLQLVTASGQSSCAHLQNISCEGAVEEQAVGFALAVAQDALGGTGAFRVHGGGFAGTIQAYVPLDRLEAFRQRMDAALGAGACHVLSIRPIGGTALLEG